MSDKASKRASLAPPPPASFEPIGGDSDIAFRIQIEGFEGPLDLLLFLARRQKVDLSQISILELSEQYLSFIQKIRSRHLEIAAEYLLVAAWLAYMKSCLLLPEREESHEDETRQSSAWLLWRLEKLQAMQEAAGRLMARPRLGRDLFARGLPEPIQRMTKSVYRANLYDLLSCYAQVAAASRAPKPWRAVRGDLWRMEEARRWLENFFGETVFGETAFGETASWRPLEEILREIRPALRRSALASAFAAMLEMALEGRVEIRQDDLFAPLYLRRRETPPSGGDAA